MIRMYMAEQRGSFENERRRVLSTLNFDNYQHKDKESIGKLYLLNECSLAKKEEFRFEAKKLTAHIIIPLVGDLQIGRGMVGYTVSIGNIFYTEEKTTTLWYVRNIDPDEASSFLHISICLDDNHEFTEQTTVMPVPLSTCKETWIIPAYFKQNKNLCFSIGTFNPGTDFDLQVKEGFSKRFAFVLEGAVEIEERLLYSGDGIYISDQTSISFEALTPYTIFFVLEFN